MTKCLIFSIVWLLVAFIFFALGKNIDVPIICSFVGAVGCFIIQELDK